MSVGSGTCSQRWHGLDALRGLAMLLGVYLHAALPYRLIVGDSWPVDDAAQSHAITVSIEVIHSFRMQLFFLLAGFFASLLIHKRGVAGLIQNRIFRIGLPLAVGLLLISPLCSLAWEYSAGYLHEVSLRNIASQVGTFWHLWFLRELLILSGISAVVAALVPTRVLNRIGGIAARLMLHSCGAAIVSSIVMLILMVHPWWGVHTPQNLPHWQNVVLYGVFFALGSALWVSRERLVVLGNRWAWHALAALVLAVPAHTWFVEWYMAHGGYQWSSLAQEPLPMALGIRATYAMMMVLLVLASLGFFLRFFQRPGAIMRVLSDTSYWVYLVHFPLVIVVAKYLEPVPWSAAMKVGVNLAISMPLLLISGLVLRPTVVGRVLVGSARHHRVAAAQHDSLIMPPSAPNPAMDPA